MSRKIQSLLDKAESTEYVFERDAFMAKAMKLMAQYRIDEAMLAKAKSSEQRRGEMADRDVELGAGPYVRTRLRLIDSIADNFGCRVVTYTEWRSRVARIIGFESDIQRVEALYTSLLVQATSEMYKMTVPAGVNATSARRSFLLGFAERIRTRLHEINAAEVAEYEDTSGGGVALVLADRKQEVDDELFRRYGKLRPLAAARGANNAQAHSEGQEAGSRADLGGDRRVASGNRVALSRAG